MERENGLTAARMIDAIEEAHGFISKACAILHCSRQHFYTKLKDYPTVQQAIDEIRNKRTDFVESKMLDLINDGNPTMIIFYLKTQAKDRGYVERQELTGANGEAMTIRIIDDSESGDG